jgi:hypothetical protein
MQITATEKNEIRRAMTELAAELAETQTHQETETAMQNTTTETTPRVDSRIIFRMGQDIGEQAAYLTAEHLSTGISAIVRNYYCWGVSPMDIANNAENIYRDACKMLNLEPVLCFTEPGREIKLAPIGRHLNGGHDVGFTAFVGEKGDLYSPYMDSDDEPTEPPPQPPVKRNRPEKGIQFRVVEPANNMQKWAVQAWHSERGWIDILCFEPMVDGQIDDIENDNPGILCRRACNRLGLPVPEKGKAKTRFEWGKWEQNPENRTRGISNGMMYAPKEAAE